MLQNTAWGLVLSRFSRLGSVGAQQFVRADDEIKGVVGRHDGQHQHIVGGHIAIPGVKAPGHRYGVHDARHGCLPVIGTHWGGSPGSGVTQGSPRQERLGVHTSP